MNKAGILAIDDEAQIRKLLEITLQSNDYAVTLASNGKEGLILAASHPADLIILDLGLPDIHGHEVLRQLREWFIKPIIILSVQSDEDNIVLALDSGANDYLVKPFRTRELLARIRSALRSNLLEDSAPIVTVGGIEIDLSLRTVKVNETAIKLTTTEYTLLALFARNSGKVLTHQYLLKEVWGPGYINQSQYLRVFVAQLRKKLEADPNRPKYLVTESGVGYRLSDGT